MDNIFDIGFNFKVCGEKMLKIISFYYNLLIKSLI